MAASPGQNFLELWVGPYRLALRTSCVLGVLDERTTGEPLLFRERSIPFADLLDLMRGAAARFGPPGRSRASFCVALESFRGWMAVGVDRVNHIPASLAPRLTRLPPFGLCEAHLFEGALRMPQRLLLVLDVESLAAYMAQRMAWQCDA